MALATGLVGGGVRIDPRFLTGYRHISIVLVAPHFAPGTLAAMAAADAAGRFLRSRLAFLDHSKRF